MAILIDQMPSKQYVTYSETDELHSLNELWLQTLQRNMHTIQPLISTVYHECLRNRYMEKEQIYVDSVHAVSQHK